MSQTSTYCISGKDDGAQILASGDCCPQVALAVWCFFIYLTAINGPVLNVWIKECKECSSYCLKLVISHLLSDL